MDHYVIRKNSTNPNTTTNSSRYSTEVWPEPPNSNPGPPPGQSRRAGFPAHIDPAWTEAFSHTACSFPKTTIRPNPLGWT